MDSIIAENVVRRHRTGRGIEGVSLSVQTGQCLGVLGLNGSGKTTLIHLVAGLHRVDCGRLHVLGKPAYPRPRHLRRRCGIALDTPAHWGSLSGRQNLCFFARQYGLSGSHLRRRVDELLREADLATQADEPVAVYSFGMRRKLSVIEALAHDPDLLILDEPSAGADTAFLDWMTQYVRQRCAHDKTTFIADNDVDWLARTATDAILLRDGRLEAEGPVPELAASIGARSKVDILLLEQVGFRETPPIRGMDGFRCEGNRVRAESYGNPQLPAELLRWLTAHGGRIRSMEIRPITLHEALMRRAARRENQP